MGTLILRYTLLGLGWLSLGLGLIGLLLPVMPTVPFLILSAYCFSKSSRRLHEWLRRHPRFGPLIRDWEDHRVIRPRAKVVSSAMISFSMIYPWIFEGVPLGVRIGVTVALLIVVVFIWSCPSHKRTQ